VAWHKSLALAALPSPLASQKIAPQRRKIAPCLWLAVAPGQLAWLLAEGLGSLQDGLPTWLRRAWPQQAAEDAWLTLAMTCKGVYSICIQIENFGVTKFG
jgi:hypothetical protein